MPALIAMCGLPFAGKSVLARALSRELRIRLLSYDSEIYQVHRRRAPAGSSVAAEYDFVQGIARREIGADGEMIGNFPQAFSHIGLVNAAWAIAQAQQRRG